jgi:hypothetical protein
MDAIPDLSGRVCEALIRQEFWLEGTLDRDVHILFLKIQGQSWQRIFFDSQTLFWREVEELDVWTTTPTDLFHYPQVDVGSGLGIAGQVIESIEMQEPPGMVEIHFQFENDTLLVLRHWYPQDTMKIVVSKRAK